MGQSFMAVSLVTLPILAFVLSDAVLMDRSKETSFCITCHVMEPLLDTVSTDDTSLAAIHITRGAVPTSQSCYTCHSGYGMHGNLSAKLTGVRHMLMELTGRYDLPLTLHGDFDLQSCMGCHSESTRFREQPAHQPMEIQEALLSGAMTCTGACHSAAHPPEALDGSRLR